MDRRDTTAEAAAVQRAAWRRMTGAERVALAAALSADQMEIARTGVRRRHPDLDEASVTAELVRRLHGVEIRPTGR